MSTTIERDVTTIRIPTTGGTHDKFADIVFEGVELSDGQIIPSGNCVADGFINGTPVKALCGKLWVPRDDPKKYQVCPTCTEIAKEMGA